MELNSDMIVKRRIGCNTNTEVTSKFLRIIAISEYRHSVLIQPCHMDMEGRIKDSYGAEAVPVGWLERNYMKWSGEQTDFESSLSKKEKIVKSLKEKGIRV